MSNVIAFIPRPRAPEEILRQGVELLVRAIESPRYDACINAIQKRIKATKDEDDKSALSHLHNILTDARLNIILLFDSSKRVKVKEGHIEAASTAQVASLVKVVGIEDNSQSLENAHDILDACKKILGTYEEVLWECERLTGQSS